MIINPHLGLPTEDGWTMGFAWGFMSPAFSTDPPFVIAPDQLEAFNEGMLTGQQSAIDGLPLDAPCISLRQEPSEVAEEVMDGVHLVEGVSLLRQLRHFAHFGAEAFVTVLLLMIPNAPPLLSATGEFNNHAQAVRDRLAQLGITQGALYLGGGVDETVTDCELQLTPIFRDITQARDAVTMQGRPQWVLAEWNAAAPMSGGGFTIIETS